MTGSKSWPAGHMRQSGMCRATHCHNCKCCLYSKFAGWFGKLGTQLTVIFYMCSVRPCPQQRLWPIARKFGHPCLKCSVYVCWYVMKILLTSTYVQGYFMACRWNVTLAFVWIHLHTIFFMGVAIREGTVTALYSLIRPGKCGWGGRYVYLMFGVQSVMQVRRPKDIRVITVFSQILLPWETLVCPFRLFVTFKWQC
jgi:hypothetical protein